MPQPQRTLVIVARGELPSLAAKPFVAFSGSLNPPVRLFNATLDYVDELEKAHPYLAEALPALNTDSWQGNNRGGWDNADYERLWQAYNSTLAEVERMQQIVQMERLLNADVGAMPHYFTVVVTAHGSSLRGPVAPMTPDAPLAIQKSWLWEWVS